MVVVGFEDEEELVSSDMVTRDVDRSSLEQFIALISYEDSGQE